MKDSGRPVDIVIASGDSQGLWNEYLDAKKGVAPLSRYEWKYILEESYGVTVYPLMAVDATQNVRGVLPIYAVKNYAGQSMLYSFKFGLIADSKDVKEALIGKVLEVMSSRNAVSATISSGYTPCDLESASASKTVVLEIDKTEGDMWNALRTKTRNMVRRAQKEGITVELGSQNLDEFYNVYTSRMLQKGVRIHSLEFFRNIFEYFRGNTELFVARSAGTIIGGMLLIFFNGTGAYIYGGSLVDRGVSPNQLLLWEMVRFCIEKGITLLDLGESAEGSGVYNFKIWAGGIPQDIHYYRINGRGAGNLSLRTEPFAFCRHSFLRLSSYLIMKHGPLPMKRKVGLWKRQKGSLQ